MYNKKGQDSGALQNLVLGLACVVAVAVLGGQYIAGVGVNYGVEVNKTEYEVFDTFDEVNATIGALTNQFVNEEGEQQEDSDIISTMITGAYGLIKLIFDIPELFFDLTNSALIAFGIPPSGAAILTWLVTVFVTLTILFAALALVMKVRA